MSVNIFSGLIQLYYFSFTAIILSCSLGTIRTSKFTEFKLSSSFLSSLQVGSLNANFLRTFIDKVGEEYFRNRTTNSSTMCLRWDSPKHILQWMYRRVKITGRRNPMNIIEGSLLMTKIVCRWLMQFLNSPSPTTMFFMSLLYWTVQPNRRNRI